MRGAYIRAGQESLFKSLESFLSKEAERAIKSDRVPKRLAKKLHAILGNEPDDEMGVLLLDALNGDLEAAKKIEASGIWSLYRRAVAAYNPTEAAIWVDHFVEIELASKPVDELLRTLNFSAASAFVASNPVLSPYLTDAALNRLAMSTSEDEALLPRTAGMCEFLLAQVARADQMLSSLPMAVALPSRFIYLIRSNEKQVCNPGREFFHWVKDLLKIRSIGDFLDLATSCDLQNVNESTLKRWSCGQEFPREEKFARVIKAVLENPSCVADYRALTEIGAHYWAARRLHKLLELVRQFLKIGSAPHDKAGPWATLLGETSSDRWIHDRYLFWLDRWRGQPPSISI